MSNVLQSTEFFIPMKPVGKARARKGNSGFYTPKATVSAERTIAQQAQASGVKRMLGALKISVCVQFKTPKSWGKKKSVAAIGQPHISKPDGDNILKLVCDALNGIAYHDDAQLSDKSIKKRYSDIDGISVTLSPACADL